MNLLTKIALLLTSFTITVNADVPYTFNANTKAKAAEVNANFSQLDQRVNDLDTRIDALEDSGNSSTPNLHDISYSGQYRNVGEQFVLNGRTYAMYRLPF